MKTYQHRIIVIVTAVWVVVLPFVWARVHSWTIACSYAEILPQYWPDIAIGAVTAVLLPAAWLRKSWAVWGLLGAAAFLPLLEVTYGNPTTAAWVISMVLLVLVALGVRSAIAGPSPDMKRLGLRALLTPVYGFAALGTAPAYVHFVVGAVAGFDGITKGRYFLGAMLSILCVLAAFSLWRVWLIGGRLWRYGAYINPSPKDRSYDVGGLVGAGAAFVGFITIAKPIYRAEDITFFSILLAPATCLAIIAFLWSMFDPRVSPPGDTPDIAHGARSAATWKFADLPGLVCGTAIGLLSVYYLVPRPRSGWGACDWTVFYPLYPDLWPVERQIVFDACSDDALTLSMVCGVLSLVCLVTGAFAAAIGRNATAARGARAAAIVVAFALAKLAIQVSDTPDAPYIGWAESFIAGVLIVVGAAWLGYVGGKRGVRYAVSQVQ